MKFSKKRMTGLLSLAMVGAIGVASLAIFTDRTQSTATAKAGSLDLQLVQTWEADNAEAASHFAPGDILEIPYTLTNDSTLAAKVREFFVISSDKEIPVDTFRIYKKSDLTKDLDTGYYTVNAGASPIVTPDDNTWGKDGKWYSTYSLSQFVLDGTHAEQAGIASVTPNTDANTDGKVYANTSEQDRYVILFNKNAKNTVQGAKIGVEYLAEAMQHSGTGGVGETAVWSQIAKESITFTGKTEAADRLDFNPGIPTNP